MKKYILKPCPFCGGEALLRSYVIQTGYQSNVTCKDGKCPASRYYTVRQTPAQAVKRWNTRYGEKSK